MIVVMTSWLPSPLKSPASRLVAPSGPHTAWEIETLQAGGALVQKNSHLRGSVAGNQGCDIQEPVIVQVNQDWHPGVHREIGGSLKSAVPIPQLDGDISIARKNQIQLLVIVHIGEG